MSYIGNMILETCAAASNSITINLAGIISGFSLFRKDHANASTVFYEIRNATQWEIGTGTLTHGTPDTLSRDVVLSNYLGTTARVTFIGSTFVYCAIPAERSPYIDNSGILRFGPAATRINQSALVRITANESIATSTATAIPWDVIVHDDNSIWSAGNPTRLTVPAGFTRCVVGGNVEWAGNASGARYVLVNKNGADFYGMPAESSLPAGSVQHSENISSGVLECTAGDYFELVVQQTSGESLSCLSANKKTWFSIELHR
jgi:hypothetical protein